MEYNPPPPPPPMPDYEPEPAMGPGPDEVRSQLMGPGIGLIVVSSISLLWMIISVVSGTDNTEIYNQFMEEFRRSMVEQGNEVDMEQMEQIFDILLAIQVPIIILQFMALSLSLTAGINMIRLHAWKLSVAGSIAALIPCFNGACCCIAIPLGIWALVVLNKDDVKQFFQ